MYKTLEDQSAAATSASAMSTVQRASGEDSGVYLPVDTLGGQTVVELYEPVEANGFHGAIALHGPASRAHSNAATIAPGVFELEKPRRGLCTVSSMDREGTRPAEGVPSPHSSAGVQMPSTSTGKGLPTNKRYISDKALQELTHSRGPMRATHSDSRLQAWSATTETDI
jgi:hypothetical protein